MLRWDEGSDEATEFRPSPLESATRINLALSADPTRLLGRTTPMHKPRLFAAVAGGLFCAAGGTAYSQTCADLGVPVNGHPNYQERAVHVLTNAVRIAPQQYRDTYLNAPSILMPGTYPAVGPLSWSYTLNQSGRAHATGMASTPGCQFRHDSCDGTSWSTRIHAYYNDSQSIAENIAAGQTSPLSVMSAWLLDNVGGVPAPDGSSGDGHRRNIMNGNYAAVGHGYATGTNQYTRYWVQDFGGVIPTNARCRPVSSASHIIQGSTVNFLATFYDLANQPPQSTEVVVNGVAHLLTLHLGTAARGTYRFQSPSTGSCRSYHFVFRDAAGTITRYPIRGDLRTTTEGGCTETFIDSAPEPCSADFDNSGTVAVPDIFAFLSAWFAGQPAANFDGAGGVTVPDIFAFLSEWFAGCP